MTSRATRGAFGTGPTAVAVACAVFVHALGCSDTSTRPLASLAAPQTIAARAVGLGLVRVQWPAAETTPDAAVTRYVLERRVDLAGNFVVIAANVKTAPDTVVYYDMNLDPETFYGYRVRSASSIGQLSGPSTIAGALTPPLPGVLVTTSSSSQSLPFASRDGYMAIVTNGTDSTRERLTPVASHRFSPLKVGSYSVSLRGVPKNCALQNGDSTRAVVVTDTGVTTIQKVDFDVTCRDPSLGQIIVVATATGRDLDADGYSVALSRTAPTGPTVKTAKINGSSGTVSFDDLQPGPYQVDLTGIAANCTLTNGAAKRSVTVAALSSDTLRFSVRCVKVGPIDTRPLRLQYRFVPESAPRGATVSLEVSADLSAQPGVGLAGLEVTTLHDAGTLKFVRREAPEPLLTVTGNFATAGRLRWAAFATGGAGPTGTPLIARFVFTVVDTASPGKETTTSTEITSATSNAVQSILADIGPDDATFTVAAGGGTNQSPIARANGPYSGVVGQPISLSATGSSDPDGTIASYMWSFSDQTTAQGSSVQKTFASAGTHTATLTVTDDKGATGTSTATITVTATGGGGQNQLPVAQANGPYSGTPGVPITFSAAGSTDPDGTIASYQWSFTDGTNASGQTVQKTFASAGSYTATLTVTDDRGGTATSSAAVTVSTAGGSGSKPFTLRSTFSGPDGNDIVTLTVTLDLSADIPETTGPEALGAFAISSLRVDPAVLQYRSFNFGDVNFRVVDGNVDLSRSLSDGILTFSGRASTTVGGSGVVTLARITYTKKGASGAQVTSVTIPSQLASIAALGPFEYLSRTKVEDTAIVLP